MELATPSITWNFVSRCPIPDDIAPVLVPGERPVASFKTFRDSATFTTHRLIVRDAQGITGKKVEVYSLPYESIHMWSSENAGKLLDLSAEIELWTRVGRIKINVSKHVDIRELDQLISRAVFGKIDA